MARDSSRLDTNVESTILLRISSSFASFAPLRETESGVSKDCDILAKLLGKMRECLAKARSPRREKDDARERDRARDRRLGVQDPYDPGTGIIGVGLSKSDGVRVDTAGHFRRSRASGLRRL